MCVCVCVCVCVWCGVCVCVCVCVNNKVGCSQKGLWERDVCGHFVKGSGFSVMLEIRTLAWTALGALNGAALRVWILFTC